MSSLVIRKFELNDQKEVVELYGQGMEAYSHIPLYYQVTSKRVYDRIQPGGDINDVQSRYMVDIVGQKKSCMWVAEHEGKIVGMIGAIPSTKYDPEEYVELVRMSVSSKCRKMGIGSRLIKVLEDWAVEQGYKQVNLYTLQAMFLAVALYEKNGYTLAETEVRDITEEFHHTEPTSINVVHFTKKLV
jgi:GNAT superfamily N-acetyltransferase